MRRYFFFTQILLRFECLRARQSKPPVQSFYRLFLMWKHPDGTSLSLHSSDHFTPSDSSSLPKAFQVCLKFFCLLVKP